MTRWSTLQRRIIATQAREDFPGVDTEPLNLTTQPSGVKLISTTQEIAQGRFLFADAALLNFNIPVSADELVSTVLDLPDGEQEKILALFNMSVDQIERPQPFATLQDFREALLILPDVPMALAGVFARFCFPHAQEQRTGMFRLFQDASYLRHSCQPNAEATYSEQDNTLSIRATSNIATYGREVEITVPRIDIFNTRAERHRLLGKTCKCPVCALSGDALAASEARRKVLHDGQVALQAWKAKHLLAGHADGATYADDAAAELAGSDARTSGILATALRMGDALEAEQLDCSAALIIPEVRAAVYVAFAQSGVVGMWLTAMSAKFRQLDYYNVVLGRQHVRWQAAMQQALWIRREGGEEAEAVLKPR